MITSANANGSSSSSTPPPLVPLFSPLRKKVKKKRKTSLCYYFFHLSYEGGLFGNICVLKSHFHCLYYARSTYLCKLDEGRCLHRRCYVNKPSLFSTQSWRHRDNNFSKELITSKNTHPTKDIKSGYRKKRIERKIERRKRAFLDGYTSNQTRSRIQDRWIHMARGFISLKKRVTAIYATTSLWLR